MQPELIVAIKEFKDYLTSKRFLLIFGVLILISIAAIISGISTYNSQLATYKQEMSRPVSTNATGAFAVTPQMPSILLVFSSFTSTFVIVGWLLAIAIGFDLISKEKETGSLKLLLARPVYRDSIINGKILGSASILVISLIATFFVSLAILLFANLLPTGDDLTRLGIYFLVIVLFCVTFLAIAIAASAVAKNSTIAILLAIGFVVFALLLPNFSNSICDIVLGQAPAVMTYTPGTTTGENNGGSNSGSSTGGYAGGNGAYGGGGAGAAFRGGQINPAYTSYENTRNEITEGIDLLSPTSDLTSISTVVINRQSSPTAATGAGVFDITRLGRTTPSLSSSLPSILPQILALVVMTIAGFAISYAKFTRMDVR